MKIKFDAKLPLVGIGVVPWARLGPERWFDTYRILSIYDWDLQSAIQMPEVTVFEPAVPLAAKRAQAIVNDAAFHDFATAHPDARFLPYKPVEVDEPLRARMLMNDVSYTKTFENKAVFREMFKDRLRFAPYKIYDHQDLQPTEAAYAHLKETLGEKIVLQHESLSGGKGTYLVNSYDEYIYAVSHLPEGRIVVSLRIEGAAERSIQVCATRYGSFMGPLQKQIIRDPQICKLDIPDVRMFCGGEIGTVHASPGMAAAIRHAAEVVGAELYERGYRGIFGLDTLVRGDEVYILEVNARLTGMTPLLTALYQAEDVPFYLLHTLELGNLEYEIEDRTHIDTQLGAQIILQAHINERQRLAAQIRSGVYAFDGHQLVFKRPDHSFNAQDEPTDVLIQAYIPKGVVVNPADRLAVIFVRQAVLDAQDQITADYRNLIDMVYSQAKFNLL